jgi:hypothetical protein
MFGVQKKLPKTWSFVTIAWTWCVVDTMGTHVGPIFWQAATGSASSSFSRLPLSNEDFGRIDKRGNPDFRSTFQGRAYSIWRAYSSWVTTIEASFENPDFLVCQSFRNRIRILCRPNEEGLTKEEIRIFDALFKGVSTLFGPRTIEAYIENLDFLFCQSFHNLRLVGIKMLYNRSCL